MCSTMQSKRRRKRKSPKGSKPPPKFSLSKQRRPGGSGRTPMPRRKIRGIGRSPPYSGPCASWTCGGGGRSCRGGSLVFLYWSCLHSIAQVLLLPIGSNLLLQACTQTLPVSRCSNRWSKFVRRRAQRYCRRSDRLVSWTVGGYLRQKPLERHSIEAFSRTISS